MGASNWLGSPPADPAGSRFHETRRGWLILAAAWGLCTAYMALHLRQGWTPCDAGVLAQSAERVLHGQLPHRDFQELYTGGLTYFNALSFRLFGVNLFSLRIPFFLLFIGWVPAVFLIARRFTGPVTAGAVTLLAVAWGPLVYPEAMASWYNLFFATWGALALLRYTETEKQRWLWIAGLCGGLSFLAKLSGLYFICAALLFFVFREQLSARAAGGAREHQDGFYKIFRGLCLLVFLVVLAAVVSELPFPGDYACFVLPGLSLVAFLLWQDRGPSPDQNAARFKRLFSMILPFLGSAFLPLAVLLGWYAYNGALSAWFTGTFFGPVNRIYWAGGRAGSLVLSYGLVPMLLVLLLAYDSNRSLRRIARIIVLPGLAVLLVASWKSYAAYSVVGFSPLFLLPAAALVAPFFLARESGGILRRQRTFLIVAVAFLCSLIEFPAPVSIYFNYVAPLAILALLALLETLGRKGDTVLVGALVAFYLAFAVWLHPPGFFFEAHSGKNRTLTFRTIRIPRAGGIEAPGGQAEEYERLVSVVRAHARGRYIYATPDCPEVYFLSGFRNPTWTMFEFLDPDFPNPILHTQNVLQAIDDHDVHLAVIGPQMFEPRIPVALRKALRARFPVSERVGVYRVRWARTGQ